MTRHATFFELLEALRQAGCPLCRLSATSAERYFASLGHEQINDVDLRAELRAGGGFCGRHAWLFLEQSGNRLGVAIVYRDLLHHALIGLKAKRRTGPGLGRRLARLLAGGQPIGNGHSGAGGCTACRFETQAEERYRSTLLEHLAEPEVRQRYSDSNGLCLPHLGRCLESDEPPDNQAWLRQEAANRLGALVGELDEYIRKHDYRFRCESWGDERDAPHRAVERAAGPRQR